MVNANCVSCQDNRICFMNPCKELREAMDAEQKRLRVGWDQLGRPMPEHIKASFFVSKGDVS